MKSLTTKAAFIMCMLITCHVTFAANDLVLTKIKNIEDPRQYDLRSAESGDRGKALHCEMGDLRITETRARNEAAQRIDTTLTVSRGQETRSITIENTVGGGRSTLECGTDRFFHGDALHGTVTAYSAERLLADENPVLWTRSVSPFKSIFAANGDPTNASSITAVIQRGTMLLVEWFYRLNDTTEIRQQVFDVSGTPIGSIGPSDLLVKTNERQDDNGWVLFQGGGTDFAQYSPLRLYRLTVGERGEGAELASVVLDQLAKQPRGQPLGPVATLTDNRIKNHMVALLTPSRTSKDATIEFCPNTHHTRARFWLGADYDDVIGSIARDALMSFWMERASQKGSEKNPINEWFQKEVAPQEPMKSVLSTFNPLDDTWIARYQQALLKVGGPTLDSLYEKYGKPKVQVSSNNK